MPFLCIIKVASALKTLRATLAEMGTVLSDEYVATPKTRTPRTSTEGTEEGAAPKKPGRPRKIAEQSSHL